VNVLALVRVKRERATEIFCMFAFEGRGRTR